MALLPLCKGGGQDDALDSTEGEIYLRSGGGSRSAVAVPRIRRRRRVRRVRKRLEPLRQDLLVNGQNAEL